MTRMSDNPMHNWRGRIEEVIRDVYATGYARGKAMSAGTETMMGCARTLLDYCENTRCEDCPFYGSANGTFFGCGIGFPEKYWELNRQSYKAWKGGAEDEQ